TTEAGRRSAFRGSNDRSTNGVKPPEMTGNDPMARSCRAAAAARSYLREGWAPIPILPREKKPVAQGWPALRLGGGGVDEWFRDDMNIGLLLGEPSHGLVDVDLDSLESGELAAAWLPPTGRRHGRTSKPVSHWWYVCRPAPPKTERFAEPPTVSGTPGATLV